MNDDIASDEVARLVEEGIERFGKIKSDYKLYADQPKHASWVTIDTSFKEFGQDNQTGLHYDSASDMHAQLLRLAEEVFTPELLEFVRSGNVIDLTLRIGPNTLWDTNLNDDGFLQESD